MAISNSLPLRVIHYVLSAISFGFGINALVRPDQALTFFEFQHMAATADRRLVDGLMAVYGVRDIFMGLTVCFTAYFGTRKALGWIFLATSAVGIADGFICQAYVGKGQEGHWSYAPVVAVVGLLTGLDSFINIAKQGVDAYQRSHTDVSKTGGHEYNSPHNSSGRPDRPNFDDDEVVNTASREGSGESSLFSSALGFLKSNKDEHERPLDEEDVQRAHKKAYSDDAPSSLPASSLGSAAALQILKQFTSDGGGKASTGSQTQLISLAMAEASKLFDKSGGAQSGNKQDAVNGAAMTVMKLLVQSKLGGVQTTGGSNSGGLGQLMGMASKFM